MLPSKPVILQIAPILVDRSIEHSDWTEDVFVDLTKGQLQWIVWAGDDIQTLTFGDRQYPWYLLGYVVAVIHPDGREEYVYPGLYGDTVHVMNRSRHLAFTAPIAGRYGFSIMAVGEVPLTPVQVAA